MKTYRWIHCTYDYATMRQGGRRLGGGQVRSKSVAQAKRMVSALVGGEGWRSWSRKGNDHRRFNGDARTSTPYWDLIPATEMIVIWVLCE